MPNCAIINCKNCTNTRCHNRANVSFHRFPQDPSLREKWIDATGKKDWLPKKYSSICSMHFDEACFVEGKKQRMLTKTAYPTIDILKIRSNNEMIDIKDAQKRARLLPGKRKLEEDPANMDETVIFRVCRICLVTEEGMYRISERGLSTMYEQLTGSTNCTQDQLPQTLCYKCVDGLSSANSFREMAVKTKEILMYKFHCKHTITLKDIQVISEQINELRNQDIKFLRIPKTEVDIEFDEESLEENKNNVRKPNNFIITNDDAEVPSHNDETVINDVEIKVELIKEENNDEMIYEYNDDDKVVENNERKMENATDVINRYKDNSIKDERINELKNEMSGFTITKLSYEEQLVEVDQRKESDSYTQAPYKCESCFTGFDIREKYKKHMEIHDERIGAFECFICKRRYRVGTSLKDHIRRRHCVKYECKSCPFVSNHKATAANHRNFHAGRTYNCQHCDAQFNQLSTYKGHLRLKHVCEFVCEWCGYTYVSQQGLNFHKKLKHKIIDNAELKGPHCKECDVTFASDEVYRRHLKLSSKHTTDLSELNRPRNAIPQTYQGKRLLKKVQCEQCGSTLRSVNEYIRHFKKTHRGVERTQHRRFICERCGGKFLTLALLKEHSLTHSGESRFGCDACGKSFPTRARLQFHVRSHTAVFECPLCGKQFNYWTNRNRHMMVTHKQCRDFKCEYCEKAFKSGAERKSHTEHIHQNKPWPKRCRSRPDHAASERSRGPPNSVTRP